MKGTEWGSWEEDTFTETLGSGLSQEAAVDCSIFRAALTSGRCLPDAPALHQPVKTQTVKLLLLSHFLHGSGRCSAGSPSLRCYQPAGLTSFTFKNLKAGFSLQWKPVPAATISSQNPLSCAWRRRTRLAQTLWQLRHGGCCQGAFDSPTHTAHVVPHPADCYLAAPGSFCLRRLQALTWSTGFHLHCRTSLAAQQAPRSFTWQQFQVTA